MIQSYTRTHGPVDHFPDAHRLTPARARALGRMAAHPQRRANIPLHLLPAATTLNALVLRGMGASQVALRTGLTVEAVSAFAEGSASPALGR